ncbi:MAG: sugar kinase [Arcobacter sp.]|nr:sugar kinase [Arcobacter sp.]
MNRLTENKIVLVIRKTRLDEIIVKFNTLEQAKFYIEHLGSDFQDYQEEDRIYKYAIFFVENELKKLGRVQVLDRLYVPSFIFGKEDTVVVVGQDGLVANTLKYLNGQSVIAINPEPSRWDGVLLPFKIEDISKIILEVFKKIRDCKEITFAKAKLQDGQYLYGVNDLFVGSKSHTSARYEIKIGKKKEFQSSSGIIVSTGLGSTGWLKSIITGAVKIVGEGIKEKQDVIDTSFDWSSKYLQYSVREPFPSNTTGTSLVFGTISSNKKMILTSMMGNNGVIFSDGIESDFIEFNSGSSVEISIAEKKGFLII